MKKILLLCLLSILVVPWRHSLAQDSLILNIPSLNLQTQVNEAPLINGEWDSSTWKTGVARLEKTAQFDHTRFAMIIAGHNPGIFTALFYLQKDDLIYLQQGYYKSTYQITDMELIYDPSSFETLVITDKPMLILLTCYGDTRYLVHAERIKMEYNTNGYD